MLSRNALKTIGFKSIDGPANDARLFFRFEADGTNVILINDLARYELWNGLGIGERYWAGALHKPESLIRKLIEFGNNIPSQKEENNGK